MSRKVVIAHGAATDVGQVRKVNEDSHVAEPPVFVVADGMGGHDGGDIASEMVIQEFAKLGGAHYASASGSQAMVEALQAAQDRIVAFALEQRSRGASDYQSGTTCAAALIADGGSSPLWILLNVGDSRIYRYFDGTLSQLSRDHSLVQELVDSGQITPEQAEHHPERNVVTRALGGMAPAVPDIFQVTLPVGARLMLCSDGVSGMISDAEIADILAAEDTDARDTAGKLVAAAVEAGGRDNATAIVVDVMGLTEENPYDSEQQRVSMEQKLGVLP